MNTNRILAVFTTAFLFAASTPCFAMWFEISATKEEIMAMGVKIRAEARGPDQAWVELEFKPEGKLMDYSRVHMDISEDKKLLVSATLKEDPNRSKDGNLIFGFWVGRTMLEKTSLSVFIAGPSEKIGGHVRSEDSFYRLELKDYVPADLLQKVQAPDTTATNVDAPSKGLEFIADFPSLEGVSLKMSEAEFLDIVTKQKLSFEKDASGEKTSYHVHAKKGATVYFGFQQGKCTGIQRLRD